MSHLFSTRTSVAYDRYTRDLARATKSRSWVHDPSFALGSDFEVYEKVRRDAVTAHAMTFRRHLISGPDVIVEPAKDDELNRRAAAVVEELLERVCMFGEARFNLSEAVFRGSAYAFMEGRTERRSVADGPFLDWWVPCRLRDVDRRRFRQAPDPERKRPVWHFWSVEREVWEELEHPEWFIRHRYQCTEDTLGYGRGLLDALHFYQASKMRVLQEGMSTHERAGQGFLKVGIEEDRPADAGRGNDTIATEYGEQLAKHKGRHVFIHSKVDDVELITGFGEGWQLTRELLTYLDTGIRVLVLGSNLPTAATTGGSFALAEIQENSTEALVQFDRSLLAETLTRDLVGQVWRQNLAGLRAMGLGGAQPPTLAIRQEKREDPLVTSQVIGNVLEAGIPLREQEVYERIGFTAPQEGDATFGGMPALADGQPVPGELAADAAAQAGTLQEQALNGAQVQALQAILQGVSAGELPESTAIQVILVAFPTISMEQARAMVGPIEVAPPVRPAPAMPGNGSRVTA